MTKHFAAIAFAAMTVVLVATVSAHAWVGTANRTTSLTFGGPVALPGVELRAGTYIFELADASMSNEVVRVWSRDRSRVYLTAFTRSVDRPDNLPLNRTVVMGEARHGAPTPITVWYPIGSDTGHQFIYTK